MLSLGANGAIDFAGATGLSADDDLYHFPLSKLEIPCHFRALAADGAKGNARRVIPCAALRSKRSNVVRARLGDSHFLDCVRSN